MSSAMRKISPEVLLFFCLAWFNAAIAQTSVSPQTALHVAPRPADVRADWKALIGEYVYGNANLTVLERDGNLFLSRSRGDFRRLKQSGPTTFTTAGQNVRFARAANGTMEVTVDGTRFVKKPLGDVSHSFRIMPTRPVDELRKEALRAKPPVETGKREPDLVEITSLDPTVKLDVRYATSDNFMGTLFYSEARAFLQRPAAEALVRANRTLRPYGYGLLIHDAYRPWFVTKMFWDATPVDKRGFVADPAKGSNHNRGGAVDLTLYDLRTGQEVEMPGGYDEMSRRSYAHYEGGTSLQRWRRDLLRAAMEARGFKVYDMEWWHFDYKDWAKYPVLNVSFAELEKRERGSTSPH